MRLSRVLLAATLLAGCSPAGPTSPETARSEGALPEGATVVAEVDGVPITEERVVALCRETGLSAEAVVERLIDFELLAAEARRRGLTSDRATKAAVRQAMVQRFLAEELEATHRPEDMPEEMLRAAYEANKSVFVRPRMLKVSHIVVMAQEGKSTPRDRAEAARLAQTIHREVAKATDVESFLEIGERFKKSSEREIRVERISRPVLKGAMLDPQFVEAALALSKAGDISPAFESSFGSHVIFVEDVRPPLNRPYEEAREEVRAHEHPFWLKASFIELSDELRLSTKVTGWSGALRRDLGS